MNRAGVMLLALLGACPVAALAVDEDAALADACPGLAAWAATHPHGADAAAAADAGRVFTQPALRAELARRAAADTRVRETAMAKGAPDPTSLKALLETDAGNRDWLKGVVARQGFPTVQQVGAQGVADAWLLAQHADRDSPFQLEVLRTLQARGEQAGVRKQDLAMLTDRALLAQGKPQRYGTQFAQDASGALAMKPVEDRSGLDARRAAVGLMPLALYRCVLGASYRLPVADDVGSRASQIEGAGRIIEPRLRDAVIAYYRAEALQDWQATYGYRSDAFRRLVRFEKYARGMQAGDMGWRLEHVEILSAECANDECQVRMRFTEGVSREAARKPGSAPSRRRWMLKAPYGAQATKSGACWRRAQGTIWA